MTARPSRLFFDTNALVDLVIPRDVERFEALGNVLMLCQTLDVKTLMCATSLKDADWIIAHNSAFASIQPDVKRRRVLAREMRCTLAKNFKLCAVDDVVVQRALRLEEYEHSFDDAIIAACAELHDADFIVTSDRAAFRSVNVPSLSPASCLALLRNRGIQ